MTVRFGYKASAEQFGPTELVDLSVRAERAGARTTLHDSRAPPTSAGTPGPVGPGGGRALDGHYFHGYS